MKTLVTLAKLYEVLNNDFRRYRPLACRKCRFPPPFRVDREDESGTNWNVPYPAPCKNRCDRTVPGVLGRLHELYDLEATLPAVAADATLTQ